LAEVKISGFFKLLSTAGAAGCPNRFFLLPLLLKIIAVRYTAARRPQLSKTVK
jgi:hypothetical protein